MSNGPEKEGARQSKASVEKAGKSSMTIRVISGAIYAIVILGCLYLGPLATTIVVAVMALLCCDEFYRMSKMSGRMANKFIGYITAVAYPFIAYSGKEEMLLLASLTLVIAAAVWHVFTPRTTIGDVVYTVFGAVYTGLMFSSVVLIRRVDPGNDGALLVFGVMGSVWLNDATAYFVGSRFGKNKLAPTISPNKSVEGFWGGLAGGLVAWIILAALHVCGVTFPIALVSGALCGAAGVLGDLFESRIKRGVGVKDSGNIIPGHGGMLDRSDSMLFASSVAFIALKLGGIL